MGQGLEVLQPTHTIHHLQVTDIKTSTLLWVSYEIQAQSQARSFGNLGELPPGRGDSDVTLGLELRGVRRLLGLCSHNLRVPLPAPPPGKGAGLYGKGGVSMSNQVTEE